MGNDTKAFPQHMRVALATLLALCVLVSLSQARVLSGTVDTNQETVYFGKFTFAPDPADNDQPGAAQLKFKVANVAPKLDSYQGKVLLNFYTNEEDKPWYFPNIWENDTLTCEQKVAMQYPVNHRYGVVVNDTDLLIEFATPEGAVTWFWTISNCGMNPGEYLQMQAEMDWNNPGSWWYRQFSVEDQNLLTIYFIFVWFWIVLASVTYACAYFFFQHQNRELDWNMFLFIFAVSFGCSSMVLYTIHYMVYAADGIGVPSFLTVADVFENLGELCFMLILLQIACLVGTPVQLPGFVQYFGGFLLFVYLLMFFWQEIYSGLNPTELLYRWNTSPGVIMIALRVMVWIMYLICGALSALQNPDRRNFLAVFLVAYSFWFLTLPCMVLFVSGAAYIHQWKIVLGITTTVEFFLYCFFLVLAVPNPLAARINTIGFYVAHPSIALGNANFANQYKSAGESQDDL